VLYTFNQVGVPCLLHAKALRDILPLYRAFVAKELIEKYNFTQVEAAKRLGITQAAISQYMTSKRGHRQIPNYNEIASSAQNTAAEVAKRIATTKMNRKEFSASFCELCRHLQNNKMILETRLR
jgi:predicted transcriptional regulator